MEDKKIHEIYKTKTNQSKELVEKVPTDVINKKLDNVLESVVTLDKLCQNKKCKHKVNLIGFHCPHCDYTYCVKHNLPEVHGCGDVCKKKEQKDFKAPTKLKQEKVTAKKHEDIKKNLSSKLDQMKLSRGRKPK